MPRALDSLPQPHPCLENVPQPYHTSEPNIFENIHCSPSLDYHSQLNPLPSQYDHYPLETVPGQLRTLASLIEQELQYQREDASHYDLQRFQLASHMEPYLQLAARQAWDPSKIPPPSPTFSNGDSVARRGPTTPPPPVPPSFGDRTMDLEGRILLDKTTLGLSSVAMPPPVLSAPSWRPSRKLQHVIADAPENVDDEDSLRIHPPMISESAQDKLQHDLPDAPEELEENSLLFYPSRMSEPAQPEMMLHPSRISESAPEEIFQSNKQHRNMFNALTHHRSFLTVDESVQILRWSAPEFAWERDTVEKILVKLTYMAGSTASCEEVTCDLKSFCFLLAQFDPRSFDDPEDIHGEMKDNLTYFRRALRTKARQEFWLQEEKIHRIDSSTEENRGPLQGKLGLAFDTIPAFVIVGNAVVIGVSADVNSEAVVWEVIELFFLFFFTAELCLKTRLIGLRTILSGPDKWWNYFDIFCIALAIIDQLFVYIERFTAGGGVSLKQVIPISLLRILKLVRLARLVRLLRFRIFNELRMMVHGVVSGVKVLAWAIVLLFFVVFILGIVMRKMIGDQQAEFSTLFAAMFTLFRCFTDGCSAYDGTPLSERLRQNLGPTSFGMIWMIFYILVVLFVTIGIFNLIMAIFIDNVANAQLQRKQHKLGETGDAVKVRIQEVIGARFQENGRTSVASARSENHAQDEASWWQPVFQRVSAVADLDNYTEEGRSAKLERRRSNLRELESEERVVTKTVFCEWLREKEIKDFLEEIDVETSTRWELFDALDVDGGGEMTVNELVSGLMKLRGPISKVDIVATRLKLTYVTELVEAICRKLDIELMCDKERMIVQSHNLGA